MTIMIETFDGETIANSVLVQHARKSSKNGAYPQGENKSFDYESLSADLAADLRSRAGNIRQFIGDVKHNAIQVGRELIIAKDTLVKRGQFIAWLDAEIGIEVRSAQRFMSAARVVEAEYDTLSCLQLSTLYKLSERATPRGVIEAVRNRAEAGELITDGVVKQIIKEARFRKERAEVQALVQEPSRRTKHAREEREAQIAADDKISYRLACDRAEAMMARIGISCVTTFLEALPSDGEHSVLRELRVLVRKRQATRSSGDDLDLPDFLDRRTELAASDPVEETAKAVDNLKTGLADLFGDDCDAPRVW
jgi:hypothetical protein